ncbi:MAG: hypothetical protein Q9165_007369 [Trypethelium subeluteriae]
MPIVCLVTYSCGHYSQRRTERTDPSFESLLDEDLFPIDEVESRNEPCGSEACADMNSDKLYMTLTPLINHAYDVLTKLETKYQDLGNRFCLIRQATLSSASHNPWFDPGGELTQSAKAAFDTALFPERRPPRSFVQIMLDQTGNILLQSRLTRIRDTDTALSQLNRGRRMLCELSCDLNTIEQAVEYLENQQEGEYGVIDNEMIADQIGQMRRAKDWVLTLPEVQRAVADGDMRSTSAVLTMFQPDRFLEPGERRPYHPLQEETNGDEFLPSLTWDPYKLISTLQVSEAPPRTHETEDPNSPNFDPDFTAVPGRHGGPYYAWNDPWTPESERPPREELLQPRLSIGTVPQACPSSPSESTDPDDNGVPLYPQETDLTSAPRLSAAAPLRSPNPAGPRLPGVGGRSNPEGATMREAGRRAVPNNVEVDGTSSLSGTAPASVVRDTFISEDTQRQQSTAEAETVYSESAWYANLYLPESTDHESAAQDLADLW